MNFNVIYRLSFSLMLVFATLVLNYEAPDNPFWLAFPVAVSCAAVIAFFTVDRHPGRGLSPAVTNVLGLLATGLVVVEYQMDSTLQILALGHWFVYFQLIYLFREKTIEIDWQMFLIGLVQVLLGTVLTQENTAGLQLFCWAVLALWVLGLFSLRRDAARARREAAAGASDGPDTELYPGLLNVAFLWSAAKVTLTTLILGGVIFLAMPRRLGMSRSTRGETRSQTLTGFDDEVQLGQIGEILEDDSEVMRVEFFDDKDNSITPDGEPLWRGVTMASYKDGKWTRQEKRPSTFPVHRGTNARQFRVVLPPGLIRQRIKLEANNSSALFGLRPMISAEAFRRIPPDLNALDGSIYRIDTQQGPYDYEVRSYRDPSLPQPGESSLSLHQVKILLGVPEELHTKFQTLAQSIIARMPEGSRDDVKARARALESYLRDSGEYFYSLELDVHDPSLDPIEDFLFNRKEGHCEYYASALALLARSVGIPSRIVNGFKGGDWNYAARALTVRQKHAHSWVEVYLGDTPPPEKHPIWLTLDPTPGIERERSVARVGGFKANFRQITDLVSFVWIYYIAGYDRERQQRLIYGPIRALAQEARKGFALMGRRLAEFRESVVKMVMFPNARSVISGRGFLVAFTALLFLIVLLRAIRWILRWLWAWYRGPAVDPLATSPGATHYRRLAQLLAEYRIERQANETQEEFAQRATAFLSGRGPETVEVLEVPRLVVEAFYRVRFGDKALSPSAAENLETRLTALESRLRGASA